MSSEKNEIARLKQEVRSLQESIFRQKSDHSEKLSSLSKLIPENEKLKSEIKDLKVSIKALVADSSKKEKASEKITSLALDEKKINEALLKNIALEKKIKQISKQKDLEIARIRHENAILMAQKMGGRYGVNK